MRKILKPYLWLGIALLLLMTVSLSSDLSKPSTLRADDSSQLFLPVIVQGEQTTPLPDGSAPTVEFTATPQIISISTEDTPTETSQPSPTDTGTPTLTDTDTPTPTISPIPEWTAVWPQLDRLEPEQARPGEEVQIIGSGGYLMDDNGGYNESARYFELYFDDELVDEILCYVNYCQGAFIVPADVQPGPHELSTEGGSSLTLQAIEGDPAISTTMARYFSSSTSGTVGDVDFADEDILIYYPNDDRWALYFDGSDVGLQDTDVNAFHVMDNGNLLLSLEAAQTIAGVRYDPSDILKFTATLLGDNTRGTFTLYLDGADVQLTEGGENIDAIALLDGGDLLISTLGTAEVAGVTAQDEDLLYFHKSHLDDNRAGSWSLYLDGSDLKLTHGNEDIWAVWAADDGTVDLSTYRNYNIHSLETDLQGNSDDIIRCSNLGQLDGENECELSRLWDGDDYDFQGTSIDGYSMGPLFTHVIDSKNTNDNYLTNISFSPEEAKYFELVDSVMNFSDAETEMLTQNGFVVSERQKWNRFVDAYAWIYWKDLPVLLTTDSMLHMVHQSYSDLLKALERGILIPEMDQFLMRLQKQISIDKENNSDSELNDHYKDVETYINVADALLNGSILAEGNGGDYVEAAIAADSYIQIELFGKKRPVDFTLFQPRGHYLGNGEDLEQYFRAMSWLAHIDFRWTEADPLTSEIKLDPDAIAATLILHQAIGNAGERSRWEEINRLLEGLVGESDNMTLPDLDRFISDTGLTAASALTADEDELLDQLANNDYGQQRITGQIVTRHISNDSADPIPRPTSFMLLGQRFAIDPYIMGQLVYDRLEVDGERVERPLPNPLDVMYTLGNDRAITHLAQDIEEYKYEDQLSVLRDQVDQLPSTFWNAPIYNQWLQMIRTLNSPTTARNYPLSMRTSAWADKMLHTQLASWTQLRHDHLLYVKQSFSTDMALCEYPAGYVEPYPEFYAALYNFAHAGYETMTLFPGQIISENALNVQFKALEYFENIMSISLQLKTLAEKELRLEEFTAEEELFLKSVVVLQDNLTEECGEPEFIWNGWYLDLFFTEDDNPALIADVHTNPTSDPRSSLYPPRVLHMATGPVVPVYMIVDTDEGSTLYVGPSFTYFEVTEYGDETTPPTRLTDQDWRERLSEPQYPASNVPEWTQNFRLTTSERPTVMYILQ